MATTYELIASQTLGSDTASVTFSSIPQTYDDLIVIVSARTARTDARDYCAVRFNGSTSNYSLRWLLGNSVAASSGTDTSIFGAVTGNNATAGTDGSVEFYVPNYAGSTNKSVSVSSASETNAATSTSANILVAAGLWSDTSAITSVTLLSTNSQNLKSGSSFQIYGISHS